MDKVTLVSLPKSVVVKLDDCEVTVRKLGLGKYTELAFVIEGFVKNVFGNLESVTTEKDFMAMLPHMIIESLPECIRLIHIATDLDEEYLTNDVGLHEALDLITAIMAVNNMTKVIDSVKNLIATFSKKE